MNAIVSDKVIVELQAKVDKYNADVARAGQGFDRQMDRIGKSALRAEAVVLRASTAMKGALAGIVASFGIREAQQLIDTATRINNALKVAGLSGAALEQVYQQLFQSAQQNAVPLETLVGLYGKIALVQGELNVSTQEMLQFTNNVALALRVAGTDAQSASGALLQLSQAMGAGTVRAEEFNSILEGAPTIARAAAAGLREAGGSVAQLRQLVVDGKVSSEAFFRAFQVGASILEDQVGGAQMTVSQGFVQLANRLVDLAREFDNNTDAAKLVNSVLRELGDLLESAGAWVAAAIGPLQQLAGWLNTVSTAAQNAGAAFGQMTGLAKVGKAVGVPQRDDAVQARIDQAFDVGTTAKQARIPIQIEVKKGTTLRPEDQVSISQYPAMGGSKGGGGRKRGGGGSRGDSFQREIEQIKERTASLNAEAAAQATVNPLVDDYDYAITKARATQELLNAAQKAGIAITPELKAKIDLLAEGYANATAEGNRLQESQDRTRQIAEDFGDLGKDVMGGFIQDLRDGKSASEALGNALEKVADKLLDITLDSLFSGKGGLFGGGKGGLLGGLLIPGILHDGGVAGSDGYSHGRSVSGRVFAGAQRYHSGGIAGLQPGEVPAILQRGEVVLPRGAGIGGGQSVVINAPINAPGADAAALARVERSVHDLARNVPKMVDQRVDTRQTRKVRA